MCVSSFAFDAMKITLTLVTTARWSSKQLATDLKNSVTFTLFSKIAEWKQTKQKFRKTIFAEHNSAVVSRY